MKPASTDAFNSPQAYEGYVGRWSKGVAKPFVNWLGADPGLEWLDVGAGTGILTEVIVQEAKPAKVVALDLAESFIEFARQHRADPRVDFRVEDALKINYETPQFDVAVSGLVLNFLASPEQAAQSMAQAVRGGGIVGAYVWDYSGRMEMMRHFWDAAVTVDPSAAGMDSGPRFTICNPDNLRALWESVGLSAVESMPIDVPTRFKDFDDYWLPFLGAQGSVSKYLGLISGETRSAVRDQLRTQLPTAADGSISLIARAWAVKGKK